MRLFVYIILCAWSVGIYGQIYESARLQQMGAALNLNYIYDSTLTDTCIFTRYQKYPVHVIIDKNHIISHIGYKIFDESISVGSKIIEHFIERYTLELAMPNPNGKSQLQRMKDDNVRFNIGTYKDMLNINRVDSSFVISLSEQEREYYFTILQDSKIKMQFVFPKDIQLIAGKDKIEIDKDLFSNTKCHDNLRKPIIIDTTQLYKIPLSPFTVIRGNSYLSEHLTNTIYIERERGKYVLLNSPYLFPKQTLQNIMLCGDSGVIKMQLLHHRYGFQVTKDTISLNTWINIANADGCLPYWGIEKADAMTINGLYLWPNERLGYLHVLFVEIPVKELWGKSPIIKCSLHSYVRMSNVADLFIETNHTLY